MSQTAKYTAFPPIALTERQWPSRSITQAPIWMSTDLRDGNQALFEPMKDRKSTRLNSSHLKLSRMPSSA